MGDRVTSRVGAIAQKAMEITEAVDSVALELEPGNPVQCSSGHPGAESAQALHLPG